MVGVTGLEPAASRTPCERATKTAPHPDEGGEQAQYTPGL